MKNPDNKPIKLVWKENTHWRRLTSPCDKVDLLLGLAHLEVKLVRAGKNSAMPHFIAIIKELETICGFKFEQLDEQDNS